MLTELISALQLAREAFSFSKDLIKETVPESSQKVKAEKKFEEAEKAFRIAEANAARDLGYSICRCTWPPQIMLRVGGKEEVEISECPNCHQRETIGGQIDSGPDYFEIGL